MPTGLVPETLQQKAESAIRLGQEKLAFDYLYASALAEDASQLVGQYQWANGLKRPVAGVRWAVGVNVSVSPKNYDGTYYPLGTTQDIPDRVSRRSRRGGATRGGGTRGGGGSGYSGGGNSGGVSGMPPGGYDLGGSYPGGGYPGGPGGQGGQASSELIKQAAGDLGDQFVQRCARVLKLAIMAKRCCNCSRRRGCQPTCEAFSVPPAVVIPAVVTARAEPPAGPVLATAQRLLVAAALPELAADRVPVCALDLPVATVTLAVVAVRVLVCAMDLPLAAAILAVVAVRVLVCAMDLPLAAAILAVVAVRVPVCAMDLPLAAATLVVAAVRVPACALDLPVAAAILVVAGLRQAVVVRVACRFPA